MSDLVERLRRQLTMSMFATKDDLYGQLHDDRSQAADRIEQLERVLAQAREALAAVDVLFGPVAKDCTQKNWIDNASDAIAAIDEALNHQASG